MNKLSQDLQDVPYRQLSELADTATFRRAVTVIMYFSWHVNSSLYTMHDKSAVALDLE